MLWVGALVRDIKNIYFLKKENGKVKYVWNVGRGFPVLDIEQFLLKKEYFNFYDHSFVLEVKIP